MNVKKTHKRVNTKKVMELVDGHPKKDNSSPFKPSQDLIRVGEFDRKNFRESSKQKEKGRISVPDDQNLSKSAMSILTL